MKRVLWVSLLFLFNDEIVSALALLVLTAALLVWAVKRVDEEREKKNARNRID